MEIASDVLFLFFVIIFGCLHVSVLYFLFRMKCGKVLIYQSPFYSLFLCIGLADIICVINIFGHSITAINRWYSLLPVKSFSKRWSTTITVTGCLFIFTLPVFIAGFRLNPRAEFYFNFSGPEAIASPIDGRYSNMLGMVNLGVYAANVGIIFIFTSLAILRYVQMVKQKIKMTFSEKHEIKLLLQSTFMFLLLSIKFLYAIIEFLTKSNQHFEFFFIEFITCQPYFIAAYSLFGSLFLYCIRYDFLK
ncbi:hypothetical protein FO519_001345 [Halicephalobus sp. NKZ332]|nr:hypothetical protein FO519_001345 [Halicephalobus sp. NKZ332]